MSSLLSSLVVSCQTHLFVHRLRLGPRRVFIDVDPNVDDGALAAGDPLARFFQSRADLAWLAHRDAPAAEALGEFFEIDVAEFIANAAALRTVLADLAAADLIHRRIVTDHGQVRQVEALSGFHVPRGHAERALAVIAQHFFFRIHELCGHRQPSAYAESA